MKKIITVLIVIVFCLMINIGYVSAAGQQIAPGPVEALKALNDQVEALQSTAFNKESSSSAQKKVLLKQIEEAKNSVCRGNLDAGMNKIEKDFKNKVKTQIARNKQPELNESINTSIASMKNASKTIVATAYGKLAGEDGGFDTWKWTGIPYAKPPVGELRWKAPVKPEAWNGLRLSSDFSRCTQPVTNIQWIPQNKLRGTEDSLYLNIYRPKSVSKKLPVYFWIHGGGNAMGGADEYPLSYFANQTNMVVVVIQYRLGPFGWFYNSALNPDGTAEDKSGNYGTLDQIQALKWVKQNISSFGGDADNVTIAGESAGGFSVFNLMASPLAKGLFHKAISQSPAGTNSPVESASAVANSSIEKLLIMDGTCKDINEATSYHKTMTNPQIAKYLRSKSADEIAKSVMNTNGGITSITPIIDGTVVTNYLSKVFESGNYNRVPVIIGCNRDEMKPFFPFTFGSVPTASGYTWDKIYNVIGLQKPSMRLDELMPEGSPDRNLFDIVTNNASLYWRACLDGYARLMKMHQDDVYFYWFKWGSTDSAGAVASPYNKLLGAGHSFEMDFIFGHNPKSWAYCECTTANENGIVKLENAMRSYIKTFIESGDPNNSSTNLPVWKKWSNSAGESKSIIFDADLSNLKINMDSAEYKKADIEDEVSKLSSPAKEMSYPMMWYFYGW